MQTGLWFNLSSKFVEAAFDTIDFDAGTWVWLAIPFFEKD